MSACRICKPIEQMGISEAQERGRRASAQLQATDLPEHAREALQAVLERCQRRIKRLVQVH